MAKMTVREFAKSVGLATSGVDYIGCTVMLKMLCAKGVAKEVDRINTSASGRGRKSVVYEIPEQVQFGLDTVAAKAPDPVVETPVVEEVEVVTEVPVEVETPVAVAVAAPVVETVAATVEAVEEQKFSYDYDSDEDDDLEAAA